MATAPAPERMLSVTALTLRIKATLTNTFPAVWVRGELSNCKRAPSGHLYFVLKDDTSVLAGMMWGKHLQRLAFEPKDGMEVEAYGGVTVYEARGQYQISALELRPAGLGARLLALEQLKQRLQAEGLFARRRPLPPYPAAIGLVTSTQGAAVRDIVKVLCARWPGIRIVIAPVRVQGPGAAEEIAAAIRRFGRHGEMDVLIVGRGGGSLEDLWAFNEEAVVRAIATSPIPVISAVGHEVDTTLADHAADVRAATPSNAAELAVRDRRDVAARVHQFDERLARGLRHAVTERRHRLARLLDKYGFRRLRDLIETRQQEVDDRAERMLQALRSRLAAAQRRVGQLTTSYGFRVWRPALDARRVALQTIGRRMEASVVQLTLARATRLRGYEDRMRALSPRRVLERGYCLARGADGTLVRSAERLEPGELLQLEFARGDADARVERVRRGGTDGA